MSETINYSIIIPHKNIPDLLQRCLDSIPRRKDVQIIVVDDNSDKSIVDFDNFPGLNDPYVEVYFTKKGKGAGYARNVGMDHAKGKWVLFADADDYFLNSIGEFLNKCLNLDCDVVVFNYVHINLNEDIELPECLTTKNPKIVFPNNCFPWCKIIDRSFLCKYNIRFQEVLWSNDLMFSAQLAMFAKNIIVDNERVYMQESRKGSLCTGVSWRSLYCRVKVALEGYCYLKMYPETLSWRKHYMDYWKELFHIRKLIAIFLLPRICYSVGVKNAFNDVYERLKIDYPKYFQ